MPEDFMNEATFSERLYAFMAARGTPIGKLPVFDHKTLDLYRLYRGVVSRGGLETVIENKLWRAITTDLDFDPDRTDAGFRLRLHYLRLLYAFERVDFLKLEDDVNLEFEHQFTKCHKTRTREAPTMVKSTDKGNIRKLPPRSKKPSIHSSSSSNGSPTIPSNSNTSKDYSSDSKSSPPFHHLIQAGNSRDAMVNFRMLDLMTLKKYKKYHRIKITHSSTKKELAEAVAQHFVQQHVDEDTVINAFVAHVKCDKETERDRDIRDISRRRSAARFRYSDD